MPLCYCGSLKGTLSSKPAWNLAACYSVVLYVLPLSYWEKYKHTEGKDQSVYFPVFSPVTGTQRGLSKFTASCCSTHLSPSNKDLDSLPRPPTRTSTVSANSRSTDREFIEHLQHARHRGPNHKQDAIAALRLMGSRQATRQEDVQSGCATTAKCRTWWAQCGTLTRL